MPAFKRFKTNYPGVYYIKGTSVATGKSELIYYIMYRKDGRLVEEKAGRQFQDDMTPARAARLRSARIDGSQLSNKEKIAVKEAERLREQNLWTLNRLWVDFEKNKSHLKSLRMDRGRYNMHIKPMLGDKEPKDLSPFDVDRLRIKLTKNSLTGLCEACFGITEKAYQLWCKQAIV